MEGRISNLVKMFENPTISRRDLMRSLTVLAGSGTAAAATRPQDTPFTSSRIDHISIQVTDLPRSIAFYEDVFGLSILNRDEANEIVRIGTTRVIVSLHRKPPTGIVDHYAIAVDGFNRDQVTQALARHGLTPDQNLDWGFHVLDPEGFPVQIVGT